MDFVAFGSAISLCLVLFERGKPILRQIQTVHFGLVGKFSKAVPGAGAKSCVMSHINGQKL